MLKSIRKIKERRKTLLFVGRIYFSEPFDLQEIWENRGRTAKSTNHNADGGKMG